jgi:hypothetical protein
VRHSLTSDYSTGRSFRQPHCGVEFSIFFTPLRSNDYEEIHFFTGEESTREEEDDDEDDEEAIERRRTSHWVVTGVVPEYASL